MILNRQEWVTGDGFGRYIIVHDLVNEVGISTVLQQSPNQIGQQVPVCTNGRIDPTANAGFRHHNIMQCFTHAMQTLKLKSLMALVGQMQNCRCRMCVMGGELRIDPVRHLQQFTSASNVADVCISLACEHGKTIQTQHLGPFNFRIPVGTFNQPNHYLTAEFFSQRIQPVQDERRARPIGLYDDTKAIPSSQPFIPQYCLNDI